MNGLPNIAQNLASKGRYGDSVLVHMTPQEVGGLQALARSQGTSLTINPSTGLPEAFSLKNLLPMAAGAALSFIPGMQPLTIGLLTGGLGALATGSLREGLMMGLGAAGGAGLAGSAANLAAPAAAAPATAVPVSATSPMVSPTLTATSPVATSKMATPLGSFGNVGAGGFGNVASNLGPGMGSVAPGAIGTGGYGSMAAGQTALSSTVAPSMATVGEGVKTAFSSPEAASSFLGSNKMNLAMAASPSLLATPEYPEIEERDQYIRPYELEIDNVSGNVAYAPGSTSEQEQLRYRYRPQPIYRAAQGGIVALAEGGESNAAPFTVSPEVANVYQSIARTQALAGLPAINMNDFVVRQAQRSNLPVRAPAALNTIEKNYNFTIPKPEESKSFQESKEKNRLSELLDNFFSSGGIAAFKQGKEVRKKIDPMEDPYDFADYRSGRGLEQAAMKNFAGGGQPNTPRFLSGGGDGMSDSIPATIGEKQPARLADGEFVIPADVVSHLGNGSSKAGAKQLYAMMDRIREQRTGKKKQAPEVNPRKAMPA